MPHRFLVCLGGRTVMGVTLWFVVIGLAVIYWRYRKAVDRGE